MKKKDTNKDILKVIKKKLRDDELEDEEGWKQINKIQKSKKAYTRKIKHKQKLLFKFIIN